MGYDWLYFAKKSFAVYPGVVRPVSGVFLADHYRRLRASRSWPRALLDALVGLGFWAWIPWRARQVQRKFGLDEAWRERAVRIARMRFADPQDLALFRIQDASELDHYIRRFEDAALNKQINPRGWTRTCALADKARFEVRCVAAGLPHPQTVALVVDGRLEFRAPPDGRRLLAKPADGEGGDGVTPMPAAVDPAQLAVDLPAALRRRRGVTVIQARLEPHPALTDLALDALPTVRIATILDEQGRPEVVSATFRFPSVAGVVVDNMKAGGLIAAVDLATGALGPACKGYGGDDHHVHPVTQGPVVGRRLPDWSQALALCRRAHAEAFPDYALIGWDVALTPNGPVLIEGNGKPGVLMPQRAARRGLGAGRYGVLLAHHLAKKA